MKSTVALLALLLCAAGAQADTPITAPFSQTYVPQGFDANDRVQITVEGSFSDSCYRLDLPKVEIDESSKAIRIEAHAYKVNGFCLITPGIFSQVIDLGHLEGGVYTITDLTGGKVYDQLHVAPARVLSQDDYTYASVNQAYVQGTGAQTRVTVSGLMNACSQVQEIKITEQDRVIVAQPILKTTPGACSREMRPFESTVGLPPTAAGRYLLHVRSANGAALNSLVNLTN